MAREFTSYPARAGNYGEPPAIGAVRERAIKNALKLQAVAERRRRLRRAAHWARLPIRVMKRIPDAWKVLIGTAWIEE